VLVVVLDVVGATALVVTPPAAAETEGCINDTVGLDELASDGTADGMGLGDLVVVPPEPPPLPPPLPLLEQVKLPEVQVLPAGQHPPRESLQQISPASQQLVLPLQHTDPESQQALPPQVWASVGQHPSPMQTVSFGQ